MQPMHWRDQGTMTGAPTEILLCFYVTLFQQDISHMSFKLTGEKMNFPRSLSSPYAICLSSVNFPVLTLVIFENELSFLINPFPNCFR